MAAEPAAAPALPPVHIWYATVTGTATDVADRLRRDARRRGVPVRVDSVERASLDLLRQQPVVVFVVSTSGQGEEPPALLPLWRELARRSLPAGLLAGVKFAVFGLGDSSYAKFNYVGKKLTRRLEQLGAAPLVPRGDGDDQHPRGVDGALGPWADALWAALTPLYGAASASVPPDQELPPKYTIELVTDPAAMPPAPVPQAAPATYSAARPFMAKVVSNTRLTAETHFQDVRRLVLDVSAAGSALAYKPGDAVAVAPRNRRVVVAAALQRLDLVDYAASVVHLAPRPEEGTAELPARWPAYTTVTELLAWHLDVAGVPRRAFFERLIPFATEPRECERLQELASPEGQDDLLNYCTRMRRTALEVLDDFPSIRIPLAYLADVFPALQPRAFSISSSPRADPGRVEITAAIVRYRSRMRTTRTGVATSWLAMLTPDEEVPVWIQPGTFRLAPPEVPIWMIGPGTGVAPFRSFVRERLVDNAAGVPVAPAVLLFGCRSRGGDFLYEAEWAEAEKAGVLKLYTAFSRDQTNKVYVQHVLAREGAALLDLLDRGGVIYLCGASKQMPKDVKAAIAALLAQRHGGDQAAGEAALAELAKQGRFQEECWG